MMTTDDEKAMQEYGFELKYEDKVGKIYVSQRTQIFICQIIQPYIPIEDFKNLLLQKGLLLKQYPCEKFIFDKRAISVFHQPSMEWYYVVWKPKIYEKFGLRTHRKLFTKDLWFRKAIEAGRNEIKNKYPDSLCHQMDIQNTETIREAIEN